LCHRKSVHDAQFSLKSAVAVRRAPMQCMLPAVSSVHVHQCAGLAHKRYSSAVGLMRKCAPGKSWIGMQRTPLAGKQTSIDVPRTIWNRSVVTTKDKANEMNKFLVDFLKDEEGLTMVEYAVAGSLITVAAVGAFTGLGAAIVTKIGALTTAVST